jgi:hypothetical protein
MGWITRIQFLPGAVKGVFFFATTSRMAVEPSQPPTEWVLGLLAQ